MTKEKFEAYENIRESGYVNMFDLSGVIEQADGELDKADCLDIMKNYPKYTKEFS